MKSAFRLLNLVMCVVGVLGLAAGSALAQDYPVRPIRFVVPYPPGGFTDLLARAIGQKLTESWGQAVVVDNRSGGGSTIGTEIVAKAPPDGYTILLVAPDLAINPSLYRDRKLPYDAVKSFVPVTLAAWSPVILALHPSVPARSVGELVALAKSKPGQLNYGSGGIGTGAHIAMELFKSMTGVNMVHVPYKGVGPAVTALLAGQVQLMFGQMPITLPHVEAGKLRALAVASAKRSSAMAELPTVAEAGVPGFEVTPWFGVVAPAGTPKEIVNKLNTEIVKILQMSDVRQRLSGLGAEPAGSTPDEFAAHIKAEIAKLGEVVKKSGARAD
jgi:tripartite-type tricarboxylate transporter receptor subunit TctC